MCLYSGALLLWRPAVQILNVCNGATFLFVNGPSTLERFFSSRRFWSVNVAHGWLSSLFWFWTVNVARIWLSSTLQSLLHFQSICNIWTGVKWSFAMYVNLLPRSLKCAYIGTEGVFSNFGTYWYVFLFKKMKDTRFKKRSFLTSQVKKQRLIFDPRYEQRTS